MRNITPKTAAWASGAVIAVGGLVAGLVVATSGGTGTAASSRPAVAKAAARPVKPLRLLSMSPAPGAKSVNGAAGITVTYNKPLPAGMPLPRLSPAIAGSWRRVGDTAVFTPAKGFPARTKVKVTVAVGVSGIPSQSSASFTTGSYRALGLQEELAQLGYLPLTWTPDPGVTVPPRTARGALWEAYAPPAGTFSWAPGYPSRLHSFWTAGKPNMVEQGAITAFEADHGMTTDGDAGPAVWKALIAAKAKDQRNTHGYSYAIASQSIPETLTIWHNGRKVLTSYANTGISVAPTPVGTHPVYEKLTYQVMQGTNPDGSHYADPVSWVSYFNGGSAVHYIGRGSYGWPQSLGCVELPYTAAKHSYDYLPYGTLVTVT